MGKGRFSQTDKENVIVFLNMVAKFAEFKFTTEQTIQYVKLLNYMQTQIVPKIEENILEIVRITQPNKDSADVSTV